MIVALAASTAFMTPVSSPVNTLVVTPGNYTFGDFLRVGAPFAVIVMLFSTFLAPWIFPLKIPQSGAVDQPASHRAAPITNTESSLQVMRTW